MSTNLLLGRCRPAWSLLILAVLIALLTFVIGWRQPDKPWRILLWLAARTLYRMRVLGRNDVPRTGPVLFVCNHVSYLDAFLLFTTVPRPVRFVVWAPVTRDRGVQLLLRWLRVIPMESEGGPRQIIRALRVASDALNCGEAVCIFAEEAVTSAGFRLPFHLGLRHILKHAQVPVVPVRLDHVWGSIFSFHGGRFLWKWPQKIPYPLALLSARRASGSCGAAPANDAKLSADAPVARGRAAAGPPAIRAHGRPPSVPHLLHRSTEQRQGLPLRRSAGRRAS